MARLQVVGLFAAAAIAGMGIDAFSSRSGRVREVAPQEVAPAIVVRYNLCGISRRNCVVDGDTLWIGEVKVRIADIDAPEISAPSCSQELERGEQAKLRLLELINDGPFEVRRIADRDADQYNRKLRVLVRDGKSLGNQLVSERLARKWTDRRQSWC